MLISIALNHVLMFFVKQSIGESSKINNLHEKSVQSMMASGYISETLNRITQMDQMPSIKQVSSYDLNKNCKLTN